MKELPRPDMLQSLSSPPLEEFRDPKAKYKGKSLAKVSDLKGHCIVLSPCESGKMLVEVKTLELFIDQNGIMVLGKLEGNIKWGNSGYKKVIIDKTKQCKEDNLERLKSFNSFYVGLPSTDYQFYIEKLRFKSLSANGYKIAGITRVHAADLVTGLSINDEISDAGTIQCVNAIEWRCVNWACSSPCPWFEHLPGGGLVEHCDCRDYGFCSYFPFRSKIAINANRLCRPQGYWSLATRC